MPPAVPRLRFFCRTCSKPFLRREKEIKKGHPAHYCSMKCRGLGMRRRVGLTCQECSREFQRTEGEKARRGKLAWCSWRCWKKWQRDRCSTYPKIGSRHAHRVSMEEKLGRPLRAGELVHHKDGKKKNFDKANLDLTDRPEHARLHFTGAVFSKAHRKKISAALKGRPKSLAHREALSRSKRKR